MAVEHSTNEIYRDEDMNRILTDDLNAIETDIEALESGKADTNHTHTGYATADHTHSGYAASSHTHTQSEITGLETALAGKANTTHTHDYAAASHTHTQSDITGLTDALAGKADATHTHDYAASEHTHAQSDITGLADALAGKAAANHTHDYAASDHTHTATDVGAAPASHTHAQSDITGLTDAIAGKADSSHTHVLGAITGLLGLLMTDSAGGVKQEINTGDMLDLIKGWAKGAYTAYFKGGACTNMPKSSVSWRCIVHKSAVNFGWVLAFGSEGSVFSNYLDNNSWQGWKAIYDATPAPLWGTSGYYMSSGHTVTPSKKLSECQHGWILLWSDYNPTDGTTGDYDYATTVIPKTRVNGDNWSGQSFLCDVPSGLATTSPYGETRILKMLRIYDNKIEGNEVNVQGTRTDVVLRAVYEF